MKCSLNVDHFTSLVRMRTKDAIADFYGSSAHYHSQAGSSPGSLLISLSLQKALVRCIRRCAILLPSETLQCPTIACSDVWEHSVLEQRMVSLAVERASLNFGVAEDCAIASYTKKDQHLLREVCLLLPEMSWSSLPLTSWQAPLSWRKMPHILAIHSAI